MAQKGVELDRETISCSICLDLLKDPVTTPCGHSYCMDCIKTHWDGEDEKEIHSCPQCRQTFTPRPVLLKNTMLAVIVEELKKTGLQAAPADHCYAGPEDVACDVCTGRKLKALKSCLVCVVSYCEQHLQPHYESPAFEKHKLVEPSNKLQENICSRHDEVMEMLCSGHDTDSVAAERVEKQKELEVSRQNIQQRIQDRQKDVKLLQQKVEAINHSAETTMEKSEMIFNDVICSMERRHSDLKQQVRSQQKTEVSRVKDLKEKLEQEITELKRKDAELMKLSHTEDHTQFLHNYSSLSALSESTDSSSINIRPLRYFDDVTAVVADTGGEVEDVLCRDWTNILQTVTGVSVLLSNSQPEPKTRAEFLKYSRELTLNPNTANRRLILSEGNRKATVERDLEMYSDNIIRLYRPFQVLSKEGLTGRCYWEVEWRGSGVSIAVVYKNISRQRHVVECGFGFNDKSWALQLHKAMGGYTRLRSENLRTTIQCPQPSRVGVYLDHNAGILSFYSISDTMTLLHRVQTTFTQTLCAGFWLQPIDSVGDTAEFCKPSSFPVNITC